MQSCSARSSSIMIASSILPSDSAPGHRVGLDANPVLLGTRRPGSEFQRAQPRELGAIDDLASDAIDHDAPSSVEDLVNAVDLERHGEATGRARDLRARITAEHDALAIERVIDWEDHRPRIDNHRNPSHRVRCEQTQALVAVEYLKPCSPIDSRHDILPSLPRPSSHPPRPAPCSTFPI